MNPSLLTSRPMRGFASILSLVALSTSTACFEEEQDLGGATSSDAGLPKSDGASTEDSSSPAHPADGATRGDAGSSSHASSGSGSGSGTPQDAGKVPPPGHDGGTVPPMDDSGLTGDGGICSRPSYPEPMTLCASGNITSAGAATACGPLDWQGSSLNPPGPSACGSTTTTGGHWELWCTAPTSTDAGAYETAYLVAELDGLAQTNTTSCAGAIPDLTVTSDLHSNPFEANTLVGGVEGSASNVSVAGGQHFVSTGCVSVLLSEIPTSGTGNAWVYGLLQEAVGPQGQCSPSAVLSDSGTDNSSVLLGFTFSWP